MTTNCCSDSPCGCGEGCSSLVPGGDGGLSDLVGRFTGFFDILNCLGGCCCLLSPLLPSLGLLGGGLGGDGGGDGGGGDGGGGDGGGDGGGGDGGGDGMGCLLYTSDAADE